MKAPQIVLFATEDWLGHQLREVAAGHRWLARESRQLGAFTEQFEDRRPSIAIVPFDPAGVRPEVAEVVARLASDHPEVAIVAVSESKIPEHHLPDWTAALLDLGCRGVLFPPLTRAVLEDLLSGLMNARPERL